MDLVNARRGARRVRGSQRQDSDNYPFGGGLNLIDSPLSSKPGQCQSALNYEMGFEGGYKRIGGYEAFDGRSSASRPDYHRLPVALERKPTYEARDIALDYDWPLDQELVRGKSSGAMGHIIALQEGGGYGTNVLLYNTSFDSSEWDFSAGTGDIQISHKHAYNWTAENAVIPYLPRLLCDNTTSDTYILQALNDPIAVTVGDMLYVSALVRHLGHTNDSAVEGLYLQIANGVSDPFGSPSSTPQVHYDIKRGAVVSQTDHFDAVGVDIISDKVLRLWARTKMCTTADASLTVQFQMLNESPVGTWNSTFNGGSSKLFFGAPMAIVLEHGTNPQNYAQGRTLNGNWTRTFVGSITDAATTWTSGVYPNFSRIVDNGSGSTACQMSLASHIYSQKGDKLYVEFYVAYTSGGTGLSSVAVQQFSNDYHAREEDADHRAAWDLENGVVCTLFNGAAVDPDSLIESQTIEEISTGIYKCTVTFAAYDHASVHAPIIAFGLLNAQGDFDSTFTHSGLVCDITGIRIMSMQAGGTEVRHAEIVTKSAAKNCNTGYAILAGRTQGPKFIADETLEMLSRHWNSDDTPTPEPFENRIDIGTAIAAAALNDEPNATLDSSYRAASLVAAEGSSAARGTATYYIADNTPVRPPGSGPVRGMAYYNGFTFCFRDSEDGATAKMWKSSGVGWREVSNNIQAVAFDAGTGTEPSPGDEITDATTGRTGLLIHVKTSSGAWGTDAAGTLWVKQNDLSDRANGWTNNGNLQVGGVTFALVNGAVDPLAFETLAPGGKYEFRAGNLYGASDRERLYWANGVDTAYEYFDLVEGFVPIVTGMVDDTPTHLAIHNYHLFLGFKGGSVQLSSDGSPHNWTVITGATEIAVGDEISGFNEEVGNSLFIFTRNKSFVLQGNTRANFSLDDFNVNAGAHEWSVQRIGLGMFFDDRGFTSLLQTQRSGSVNFQENAQSELIQPLIEDLVRTAEVKTSHLIRKENIYRCYFNDGRIISIGFSGHKISGHMPLEYPFTVNVSVSEEAETGAERIFVGTDDGDVYELEIGPSFNGEAVAAFIRTVLYHSKTPGRMKKYSHIRLDGTFKGDLNLQGRIEADFDDPDWNLGQELDFSNDSAGGYWDNATWDSFIWDKTKSGNPQEKLEVEGTNVSIYLHTESAVDESHTLRGCTMQWMGRRSDRRV